MKKATMGVFAAALLALAPTFAVASQPVSRLTVHGIVPQFDHIFIIMMENHQLTQVVGNVNAPFMSALAASASSSTQYYGVGHPSLVNYLELTGGSNFGVNNDLWPNWLNGGCVDNAPGSTSCVGQVTALTGTLTDIATPTTATVGNGSCNGQLSLANLTPATNNCAIHNYPSERVTAETIADQLVAAKFTWKTYQQSLPTVNSPSGKIQIVDGINYSDGSYSNLQPVGFFTATTPVTVIPKLYAVKHDPFVYFKNVQQGSNPQLSEARVADFDANNGLYADLALNPVPFSTSQVSNLSFIVPNQCMDIHGLAGTETECNDDPQTMAMADANMKKLVTSIEASAAWKVGHNAIVILFDENDYSNTANVVPFIVVKNYGRVVHSSVPYDHFSLLKTLEAGFGLPCLNHACDATSQVMGDLFAQ